MTSHLTELEGHYRGFFPSDESDLGIGEASLNVDSTGVTMRVATGLEIQEFVHPSNELWVSSEKRELNGQQITVWTIDVLGSNIQFTFVVMGSSIDAYRGTVMGPALFKRDMTENDFADTIRLIAEDMGEPTTAFPLLANGGMVAAFTGA